MLLNVFICNYIFIFHSTKWLLLVQRITRAEGYQEILLVFGLMSDKQCLSGKYFESAADKQYIITWQRHMLPDIFFMERSLFVLFMSTN